MTVLLGGDLVSAVPVRPERGPTIVQRMAISSQLGRVELMGTPWSVLPGAEGLSGPEIDSDFAASPSFDGAVLRSDRPLVSQLEVFLPLLCDAPSPEAVAALMAELRMVTRWTAENLKLTAVLSNGSQRFLPVRRVQTSGDLGVPRYLRDAHRLVGLRLRALYPWWSGEARSIRWAAPSTEGSFFPILPVRLTASAVLGNANPVEVGGDIDTYPVWTVQGPFESLTVQRGDGQQFTVDEPLAEGDTLTIRTDPRESSRVEHSSEGNWWQHLAPGSQLFPLRALGDAIEVTAAGSEASTSVGLSWEPRYEVLL